MSEPKKKFYKARSSGLIARIGNKELAVKKDKIYEWGDDEAAPFLANAPENFVECNAKGEPLKPKTTKGGK